MSNHKHDHNCCCCDCEKKVEVKQLMLDDGRRAERHFSVDDHGNEIVEIFAEEKRPLKIEKRIVKEHKRVVAKETHETIKDGEVSHVEVFSGEPDIELKVRERIGVADHHKLIDGDYVRKDEIGQIVADGVVEGVSALMENSGPVVHHHNDEPIFTAQSVVEQNVADKKKGKNLQTLVLSVVLLAQVAFFSYLVYVM